MVITYVISDALPTQAFSTGLTAGLTIVVNRDCPLGQRQERFTITSLGDVGTKAAAVLAWIAADLSGLQSQIAIQAANQAIQAAFEAIVGNLTITYTI